MDESTTPDDVENPEQILDEIASTLDARHAVLVKATNRVGYLRDEMQALRPLVVKISDASTVSPEAGEVFRSQVRLVLATLVIRRRDKIN